MPFDPFGDFATRGYLRNVRGLKRKEAIKRLERIEYEDNVTAARAYLAGRTRIDLEALHQAHRLLFGSVYPWAGQDREALGIRMPIFKGRLHFAAADQIRRISSQALALANDAEIMTRQPGTVIGDLCYAHPFLEGNGRTILAIHTELARRAGISIDWRRVPARAYLIELTKEIVLPGEQTLDLFLAAFVAANPDRSYIVDHQPRLP